MCACVRDQERRSFLTGATWGREGREGDNRRLKCSGAGLPLADADMWEVRKARPIPSSPGEKERNESVECGAD